MLRQTIYRVDSGSLSRFLPCRKKKNCIKAFNCQKKVSCYAEFWRLTGRFFENALSVEVGCKFGKTGKKWKMEYFCALFCFLFNLLN